MFICEGDPELSMTRNCRVHCIYAREVFFIGMKSERELFQLPNIWRVTGQVTQTQLTPD